MRSDAGVGRPATVTKIGLVAQLTEQAALNRKVASLILAGATKCSRGVLVWARRKGGF